jgi:membrane dipeptidase
MEVGMKKISLRWTCFRAIGSLVFALMTMCGLSQADDTDKAPVVVSPEAEKIHQAGFVFDGHNDLPWAVREKSAKRFAEVDIRKPQPDLHTDIDRLRKGNVGAQFWSVFVPVDTIPAGNAFQTTVEQISLVKDMVARYPDVFELAMTTDDVERIRKSGKIASLIGMEGGHSIENSIQKLRELHSLGARYMTLTHSQTLDWADSATDVAKSDGLAPFGEEVVREMNRLGMLVDISHVSPATMLDAIEISQAPVIFSHSSARGIADHPRNVPDEVLRELPKNGGVVMVNFFSGFVVPESAQIMKQMFEVRREIVNRIGNNKEEVDKEYRKWQVAHPYPAGHVSVLINHIDHIVRVAGIDHVGLGSDFDGIAKAPVGIEDVSKYPVLTELLLRKGYSAEDIHKIMSGNVIRAMKQMETASAKLQNASQVSPK